MRRSGRRDVPDVVAVVALGVARLLVVLPEVKRLALVGPLLAAVIAGDHGPRSGILGVGSGHQRRPVGGAVAVAARLTGGRVPVVDIERHALGIDQRLALRGIADLGGFLRQCDARSERARERDKQDRSHVSTPLDLSGGTVPALPSWYGGIPTSRPLAIWAAVRKQGPGPTADTTSS